MSERPGGDPQDDIDDVTLWAGRLRAWPVPPGAAEEEDVEDLEAEATVFSPRRSATEEATVRSARRADAADALDVTPEPVTPEPVTPEPVTPEPVTPEPAAAEPAADETVITSRRGAAEPDDGATALVRPRGPEGSTGTDPAAASTTGSAAPRLRDRSQHPAPLDAPAGGGRETRVPSSGAPQIYRPRADAPAMASRVTPAPRAPQPVVDVARGEAVRSRRRRRRALIATAVGVVGVAAAVAAVIALLVTGG